MEKNTILSINNYEEIKVKNNNNNRNKKHKKIINYENDFTVKYLGKLCVFGEIILLIIYNYSLFNYYIIPIIKNKPLNIFLVKYSKFNILISIFVILDLILCFISFFVTYFTPPATVPNNSIFYSYLNENLNQNKLLNILNNNRNKIPKQINNNNNNNINLNISFKDYYIINERTEDGLIRFCETCKIYKPDRCHHCKYCNKCMLKLDHHCFWFDNCITFNNYKYFYCSVFYGMFMGFFFIYIFFPFFKNIINFNIEINNFSNKIIQILFLIIYFITFLLTIFVTALFIYHTILVLNNYTTFEFEMTNKEIIKNSKNKIDYFKYDKNINISTYTKLYSKYDTGLYNNWISVFGENIFLWFLPIKSNIEDEFNNGINFKQNKFESLEIIKSL